MSDTDLTHVPDDDLDQLRRNTIKEQERRQKLHEGKEIIGQAVRDYMNAAKLDCPNMEPADLGQTVVDLLAQHPSEPSERLGRGT